MPLAHFGRLRLRPHRYQPPTAPHRNRWRVLATVLLTACLVPLPALTATAKRPENTQPPPALTVRQVTTNSFAVRWKDNPAAKSYTIRLRDDTKQVIKVPRAKTKTYTYRFANLHSASTFKVRIRANFSKVSTAWTDPVRATTLPDTPAAPAATFVGTSAVSLQWPAVPRAKHYRVTTTKGGKAVSSKKTTEPKLTIKKLTAATTYSFTVIALGPHKAASEVSRKTSVTTRTVAAEGLHLVSADVDRVTLAWGAVAGADAYKVQIDGPTGRRTTAALATTQHTITGLAPGTNYQFRVIAFDAHGQESESSLTLSVSTRLPAPSSASGVVRTNGGVTVTWSPVVGATHYVLRATTPGGSVILDDQTTSATTLTTQALPAGTVVIEVSAQTELEASRSDPARATVTVPLLSPTTLRTTDVTTTSLALAWSGPAQAIKYVVRLTSASGSQTFTTTASHLTVARLTPGTSYSVAVSSWSQGAESPPATSTVTTRHASTARLAVTVRAKRVHHGAHGRVRTVVKIHTPGTNVPGQRLVARVRLRPRGSGVPLRRKLPLVEHANKHTYTARVTFHSATTGRVTVTGAHLRKVKKKARKVTRFRRFGGHKVVRRRAAVPSSDRNTSSPAAHPRSHPQLRGSRARASAKRGAARVRTSVRGTFGVLVHLQKRNGGGWHDVARYRTKRSAKNERLTVLIPAAAHAGKTTRWRLKTADAHSRGLRVTTRPH